MLMHREMHREMQIQNHKNRSGTGTGFCVGQDLEFGGGGGWFVILFFVLFLVFSFSFLDDSKREAPVNTEIFS